VRFITLLFRDEPEDLSPLIRALWWAVAGIALFSILLAPRAAQIHWHFGAWLLTFIGFRVGTGLARTRVPGGSSPGWLIIQGVLDIAAISVVVAGTGGWTSPLYLLYLGAIFETLPSALLVTNYGLTALIISSYTLVCVHSITWHGTMQEVDAIAGRIALLITLFLASNLLMTYAQVEHGRHQRELIELDRANLLRDLLLATFQVDLNLAEVMQHLVTQAAAALHIVASTHDMSVTHGSGARDGEPEPRTYDIGLGVLASAGGEPQIWLSPLEAPYHVNVTAVQSWARATLLANQGFHSWSRAGATAELRQILLANAARCQLGDQITPTGGHVGGKAQEGELQVLLMPLEVSKECRGILAVARWSAMPFSLAERELLWLLSREAGPLIRNAWLYTLEQQRVAELRRLEQMKRDFLSNISHELLTPLSAITAAAGILAAGASVGIEDSSGDRGSGQGPRSWTARQEQLVCNVSRNCARLNILVTDLLEMSRLQNGMVTLYCAPVACRSLVENVVAGLRPLFDGKRQRVQSVVPAHLMLWADRMRAEQVLVNLLSNAHKYSPAGSVIEVTAEERGSEVILTVRDHGEGIAASQCEQIFERFYRCIDGSGSGPGAGLGLAIARSLVELHGGRIWVESALGEGSAFRFSLPSVAARQSVANAAVTEPGLQTRA
jgi:signal transduction histidine kinase